MEIKDINGKVLYSDDTCTTIKELVEKAVFNKINLIDADLRDANLICANLRDADLRDADLRGANLICANLIGANLIDANLIDANLIDADLESANLRGANLRGANLRGANLRGANLRGANLIGANLICANLRGANLIDADLESANLICANLIDADLRSANLISANLRSADLRSAKKIPYIPLACPSEGPFIGWKKVNNCLIKLEILENSKRSSATTNKCRCDKAKVLSITEINDTNKTITKIINTNYKPLTYEVGEIAVADKFDEDRWNECSNGIHFFINKQDAINY